MVSVSINIPTPGRARSATQRFISKYTTKVMKLMNQHKSSIESRLKSLTDRYYKSRKGLINEKMASTVGATGDVRAGEKAYWLVAAGHHPKGPCPLCLWIQVTYSKGADIAVLKQLANNPRHAAIHMNSRIHNPLTHCHCKIIPYRKVSPKEQNALAKDRQDKKATKRLPLPASVKKMLAAEVKSIALSILPQAAQSTAQEVEQEERITGGI